MQSFTNEGDAWKALSESTEDTLPSIVISDCDERSTREVQLTQNIRADNRFDSVPVMLTTTRSSDDFAALQQETNADLITDKKTMISDKLTTSIQQAVSRRNKVLRGEPDEKLLGDLELFSNVAPRQAGAEL